MEYTDQIVTNSDVQLIKQATVNYLWSYGSGATDFSVTLKMLTGNKAVLPFRARIIESRGVTSDTSQVDFDPRKIIPGNYSDDFIYTLTF